MTSLLPATARITVPDAAATGQIRVRPLADAGDDQLAMAGRQVTLHGGGSEPRGTIGYRWIHVAGPKVRLKVETGPFFPFVPTVPGIYRFALLVAAGSQVSDPDEVTITVGAAAPILPGVTAREHSAAEFVEDDSVDQIARRAAMFVHARPELVDSLASTFEEVAARMDLYEHYTSMFQELSQRLEAIIPAQPSRRKIWLERVFSPLTQSLIPLMQAEGLDLGRPEGLMTPFSSQQRARLAEQFRLMAEGFRAVKKDRDRSLKTSAIDASTE
jgi:hypothetical protein